MSIAVEFSRCATVAVRDGQHGSVQSELGAIKAVYLFASYVCLDGMFL